MKRKRLKATCMIAVMLFSISTGVVNGDTGKTYNIHTAVERGINSSILLQQLEYKAKLATLKVDAYDEIGVDLRQGQQDITAGTNGITQASTVIDSYQAAINQAKVDILNGILPAGTPDVTITTGLVIKAKDNIVQKVKDFNTAHGTALDSNAILSSVTAQVNVGLAEKQKQLDAQKTTYDQNLVKLEDGNIDYKIAKAHIAAVLADKLDMSELNGLSVGSSTRILSKMSRAAEKLSLSATGIYRNQIAMQIENNYYNALKAKKIMEMKIVSEKRAATQYQFAKDSYESGMKAKDDMMLAEIYYTGTTLEVQKSMNDYDNALIELKKNLNLPMDSDINLEEATVNNVQPLSLRSGIDKGLQDRLEVVKAVKQEEIYMLNMDLVQEEYSQDSKQYTESNYLRQNAKLELDRTKNEIECAIRQSFNTMTTMENLLKTSDKMVNQAKDCLEIAQAKYEAGYGADSSMMKKLGLEASNGTILEVISAQENLAQVEEKYVEILYGYNLSKTKYLNDIAYLTY